MSDPKIHVRRHGNGWATVTINTDNVELSLSLTANELEDWQEAFNGAES